jgi:hypothetical protein
MRAAARAWIGLLLLAGCEDYSALSSEYPITGTYRVVLTQGENGCGFGQWTPGTAGSPFDVVITQSGPLVSVSATDLVATYLDFVAGSHTFSGMYQDGEFVLQLVDPLTERQMTCQYHVVATLHLKVMGSNIMGTIDFTVNVTQVTADCGSIQAGCKSQETFAGSRH